MTSDDNVEGGGGVTKGLKINYVIVEQPQRDDHGLLNFLFYANSLNCFNRKED